MDRRTDTALVPADKTVLVIAVWYPDVRRRSHDALAARGAGFTNVVHSTAIIALADVLGSGLVLAPYSVMSAHAWLGHRIVLNFHAVVQHDAVLGAWSQLNSHANAGGFAVLDEEVLVATDGVVPSRSIVPLGYVFYPTAPN